MRLTRHELGGAAAFDAGDEAFTLAESPFPDLSVPPGRYALPRRTPDAHLYRLSHPLAERLIARAKGRDLPSAEVVFDYHGTRPGVRVFEPLVGQGGELFVCRLTVESMGQAEDHLLAAAVTDDGPMLMPEVAAKFFQLSAADVRPLPAFEPDECLHAEVAKQQAERLGGISERNGRLFEEETTKLDGWADDLKVGLERDIKDLDRQLKDARRAATAAPTLEAKLAGQKEVRRLDAERTDKRRKLFAAQDEIDARREALIAEVEGKLTQTMTLEPILSVRWRIQ